MVYETHGFVVGAGFLSGWKRFALFVVENVFISGVPIPFVGMNDCFVVFAGLFEPLLSLFVAIQQIVFP